MNAGFRRTLGVTALCGILAGAPGGGLAQQPGTYLGPWDVVACKNGRSLLVLSTDAKQIVVAIDEHLKSLEPVPSPHPAGGHYTAVKDLDRRGQTRRQRWESRQAE